MHREREIDRYLAVGLSVAAAGRMHSHLRNCDACRRYHDEQVALLRALAGRVGQATRQEDERTLQRALDGIGAPRLGAGAAVRSTRLADALVWARWRWFAPAFAAAVVLIGALWWRSPDRSHRAPPGAVAAARIVDGKGAQLDGRAASPGATVSSAVELSVPPTGFAELELVRGGRVHVFPGSKLRLTPRGESVELADGKLWCEVDRDRGSFTVRTERAEARVLGTSFVVENVAGGDTDVRVMSGTVEVEDVEHRGKVRAVGGQRTRVVAHAGPTPLSAYSPDSDRLDWNRLLEQLERALRRTLQTIKSKVPRP